MPHHHQIPTSHLLTFRFFISPPSTPHHSYHSLSLWFSSSLSVVCILSLLKLLARITVVAFVDFRAPPSLYLLHGIPTTYKDPRRGSRLEPTIYYQSETPPFNRERS